MQLNEQKWSPQTKLSIVDFVVVSERVHVMLKLHAVTTGLESSLHGRIVEVEVIWLSLVLVSADQLILEQTIHVLLQAQSKVIILNAVSKAMRINRCRLGGSVMNRIWIDVHIGMVHRHVMYVMIVAKYVLVKVLEAEVGVVALIRMRVHVEVMARDEVVVETAEHGRRRDVDVDAHVADEAAVVAVVSGDAEADLVTERMMRNGNRSSAGS